LKKWGITLALHRHEVSGKLLTPHPMCSQRLRIAAMVAALFGALPSSAHAQIFSWRDGGGNLVLSDRPHDGAAVTFAVGSSPFRTTRAATAWRNTAFDTIIAEHATLHGLRPDLIHAVIQAESGFNPAARSNKGAMGLMQLMPATAVRYGVTDAFDPAQNIRAGVAYLKGLLERYSHNEELALAAYNAGPGAVEKYGAVPPYRETREYVARIRRHAGDAPAPTRVYRVVETKDGREVVRYTNVPAKPDTVSAER
jgi:soluble lytic murein transglycosylase-like protein